MICPILDISPLNVDMEGGRYSGDIVHVLMKVAMSVTFFMEGAHFLKQSVYYGGCASYFNIKIFFRVNQAVFPFSPIFLTFSITSIKSKAKTTASSIPAWSPTAVLTGPFHA